MGVNGREEAESIAHARVHPRQALWLVTRDPLPGRPPHAVFSVCCWLLSTQPVELVVAAVTYNAVWIPPQVVFDVRWWPRAAGDLLIT